MTVSFSFSVVVAVTVMVNSWLGLIGVTMSGEFDVDDGVESEAGEEGDDEFGRVASVFDGLAANDEVSKAGCRVAVG